MIWSPAEFLAILGLALLENDQAVSPKLRQELTALIKRSIAQHERREAEQTEESSAPVVYDPIKISVNVDDRSDRFTFSESVSGHFPEEDQRSRVSTALAR
ncbi:MAG: hypothetical protein QM296_10885 [Bacillota bacterium]|nr:hypothetical protein [Bacillota bacterium]